MKTRIAREDLIHRLEEVSPGLAAREIVEQASCFIFLKGKIQTFNEEILCTVKSGLPKEMTGAVKAKPLLDILRKLPEQEVEVEIDNKKFMIYGKNKKTGVGTEAEILLPVDSVEKPSKWKPLHKDFTDAIGLVHECASKDESSGSFTCVHIHTKWVEACDDLQMARYRLKTGVQAPFLVRRDSIKHVISGDYTEFAETENWIHFKSSTGGIMACRRFVEEYPDLTPHLNCSGTPTVLPVSLAEAAERAAIFSSENVDDNLISVKIKEGRLYIKGEGASGFHHEDKKVKYNGKSITFGVSPKLLGELLKRTPECEITEKHHLKVDGGKFRFVVCLEKADVKEKTQKKGKK